MKLDSAQSLSDINDRADLHGLCILGSFHPKIDDFSNARTLVMLGPDKKFWDVFSKSMEYLDGTKHPMDRWSSRVIGAMADELGARALFPFGGPPYAPFIDWAKQTGQSWESPVGMLVHDKMGLMVSYRGALAFDFTLDLPQSTPLKPCETCVEKPCLTACPVSALTSQGYDVSACHTYLDTTEGRSCFENGCQVRKKCPASLDVSQNKEHSSLHMRSFRGET